ncbi:MAG: histidinol-phosphate transaminase [Acidobacteriota bacterium]
MTSRGVDALVRPEVLELKRYHLDLSPCEHKLDQNEVPYDLPAALKQRAADRIAARSWAVYPDFHADALRAGLGARHGWPAEGVLVGNGSNELLSTALEAIVRPSGEVLGTHPSFGLYRMFVLRAAGVPRFLGPRADLRLPIDELLREVERDPTRPVILCTPNNPTGDAVSADAVEALLEALEAPLLLDNAYGEFSRHDYRPLLARHRHLLLFRTFSKAWSLGGARLGYLLADPELVGQLIKVKLPYNVGFATAFLGEEALATPEAAERRVRVILGRRPQWTAMLEELGFSVLPSEANFLLARLPEGLEVAPLVDGLEARGIRIRNVSGYPGLSRHVRVSVGSGRALRDVRDALGEILEQEIVEERER